MKKRMLKCSMLIAVMAMMLTGCGAGSDSVMTGSMNQSGAAFDSYKSEAKEEIFYESPAQGAMPEEGFETEVTEAGQTGPTDVVQTQRKLIKTVDMTVETKTFDHTLTALENKIAELGGYVENLETYNGSSYSGYRSSRDANMTIRIPRQSLDDFLAAVEGVSNVVRRSESVQDVTLTYVDLESHKRVLQAEQERLLELLGEAEVIEDIITIESRLSQVRYQIESMESQLRTYDNKVDYSTVYLNIEEVQELTPVEEETFLQRITNGFADNLRDVGDGLVEFAVWFVVTIPYFVVWAVVIVLVVLGCKLLGKIAAKRTGRNRKKKTAEKNAEPGTAANTQQNSNDNK